MLTVEQLKTIAEGLTPLTEKVRSLWSAHTMTGNREVRESLKHALKEFYLEQGGSPSVADIVNGLDL